MSEQLQTLKEAQAVIADLKPIDQDLVKACAEQFRAILDTEGEFAVMAFALVGAEIAAAARFRWATGPVAAAKDLDTLAIVGFRARRGKGAWVYVDDRGPDSFEIQECEIQNVYAGGAAYGRWPEVITWTAASRSLPDSDTTVLLDMPDADEPVWPGYHDGQRWLLADGMHAPRVRAWADLPGGLNRAPSAPVRQ